MKTKLLLSTLALALAFASCKKDSKKPESEPTPTAPPYNVPTSYTFTNVNFTSSAQRIAMLGEITTYIRSTHTTTSATQPTLSAQKLKDMYANAASQYTDAALNSSGIQLKDKTSSAFSYPAELEGYFDDCQPASITAAANPTTTTASNGVKGKLISPTRAILVNGNGFEYKELAEKGIMGTVFYYQAMTIMANISTYDNTIITNSLTAQEKAWDEAFGYFGVPVSFPTNTVGLKFWGIYANSVNVAIGCNSTIMNAFLKGRAAISNKDNTARDEARNVVMSTWEKIVAAKCIGYLKGAKNNLTDQATLHHNLSEGYGFVVAFNYNSAKTISDADINSLLGYFGTNLFNLSPSNLDLAISKLELVFGLNAALIP
jgi:hypothetical protein